MSRIRCGIKTAKLGSTVFGRRKPISKDWWIGVWPSEDKDVEPTQPINQNTPAASEEGYSSSSSASSDQTRDGQLVGVDQQEDSDAC